MRAAHGLDLVGDRWAMLAWCALLLGRSVSTDLRELAFAASSERPHPRLRAGARRNRSTPQAPSPPPDYDSRRGSWELEPVIKSSAVGGAIAFKPEAGHTRRLADSLVPNDFDSQLPPGSNANVELRFARIVFIAEWRRPVELVRGNVATLPDHHRDRLQYARRRGLWRVTSLPMPIGRAT